MSLEWNKSSFSEYGNCVEVARLAPEWWSEENLAASAVLIRDKGGRILLFPPHTWQRFVEGVKAGEFDIPE